MMNKLDELEKLAKEATPGPWSAEQSSAMNPFRVGSSDEWVANGVDLSSDNDMKYIAAVNPNTVLALIAVARAAEGVLHKADTAGVSHKMFGENTPAYVKPLRQALAALED